LARSWRAMRLEVGVGRRRCGRHGRAGGRCHRL
jgi:hypothetical protein